MVPVRLGSHGAHGYLNLVHRVPGELSNLPSTENPLPIQLRFPSEEAGEIAVLRKKIYNNGKARCNACVDEEQAEAKEIEKRNLQDVIRRK